MACTQSRWLGETTSSLSMPTKSAPPAAHDPDGLASPCACGAACACSAAGGPACVCVCVCVCVHQQGGHVRPASAGRHWLEASTGAVPQTCKAWSSSLMPGGVCPLRGPDLPGFAAARAHSMVQHQQTSKWDLQLCKERLALSAGRLESPAWTSAQRCPAGSFAAARPTPWASGQAEVCHIGLDQAALGRSAMSRRPGCCVDGRITSSVTGRPNVHYSRKLAMNFSRCRVAARSSFL